MSSKLLAACERHLEKLINIHILLTSVTQVLEVLDPMDTLAAVFVKFNGLDNPLMPSNVRCGFHSLKRFVQQDYRNNSHLLHLCSRLMKENQAA
mgnify:FL=1